MLSARQATRLAAATGLLVTLLGCEQATPPAKRLAPITVEASYRLLFNDALVGNSLFMLEIDADGRYALQSFTTPAGKMQRDATHEVLETSRGSIGADGVRPLEFEESVVQDGELALARLTFDWPRRSLAVEGPGGRRNIGLLPDTQDRLSYLLDAARLAGSGDDSRLLQVASAEAAEETLLRVQGEDSLSLPAGEFSAVRVERRTPDEDTSRELWFAPELMPLPLRALQASDGNHVEMQLEHLNQRRNDPR